MKKVTAFLTLIGLLSMLGGGIYLYKTFPEKLQPFLQLAAESVPEQFQSPVLISLALFALSAFCLSLLGLFGGSALPNSEKAAVPQPEKTDPPPVTEEKPETVLKSDFIAKEQELLQARRQLENLNDQIASLKVQLEKFQVNDDDKQEKARSEAEISRLGSALEALQKENADLKNKSEAAVAVEARLETEMKALSAKLEKAETDNKAARKEFEKTSSELKVSRQESEKIKQQLENLQQENEKTKAELQAALADAKSGKHGIPPAAFQILYLFQKEGRLIDLLMEDVGEFDDETLGGAIRPIHEGCRKLLKERLIIEPVLNESEGSEITIDEADPEAIKLSGNVPSKGPYKGELVHRGWRLKECHLPELVDGWNGNVVAPAEIEIG